MSASSPSGVPGRIAFGFLFVFLLWLAHALGYFAHEYAHSFTAWACGYKRNPLALNYGHFDWVNLLTQSEIDENVDYDPIFAARQGPIASLIAIAGVLVGNGISYLLSIWVYSKAKRTGRNVLALFFFLMCVMNAGNLISYIPARTFATHADMATVEKGLAISPVWLALVLGIPFCLLVGHFVLTVLPRAMQFFFPGSRTGQAFLLGITCSLIFAFYGGAGLHHYGAISHGIGIVSAWFLLPITIVYNWMKRSGTQRFRAEPFQV